MYLLKLKSSTGVDVAVPVRLPDAITFPCFVPSVGIASACLHPTSLDPAEAEVGELEVWRTDDPERRCLRLEGRQDDAAVEQADDVLAIITDGLNARLNPGKPLLSIADIAYHEACAREAWESMPAMVRSRTIAPPPIGSPRADEALFLYIEVLLDEAFDMASKAATRRRDSWYATEDYQEVVSARRASRTDAAVDRYKDGQP